MGSIMAWLFDTSVGLECYPRIELAHWASYFSLGNLVRLTCHSNIGIGKVLCWPILKCDSDLLRLI